MKKLIKEVKEMVANIKEVLVSLLKPIKTFNNWLLSGSRWSEYVRIIILYAIDLVVSSFLTLVVWNGLVLIRILTIKINVTTALVITVVGFIVNFIYSKTYDLIDRNEKKIHNNSSK